MAVASTRLRDPATGRFINAEAAARVSVPDAPSVLTEPAPVTKKDKKQKKRELGKKKAKNKTSRKKSDKKKKKKKKKNKEG